MFCPKCGAENAEGINFCASCGAGLNATTEAPVVEPAPAEFVNPAPDFPMPEPEATEKKESPVAGILEKVKPLLQKYKLFAIGALGIVALILCISVLASLFSGNGFSAVKHSIMAMVDNDEVCVLYDAKKVKSTGLEATGIRSQRQSIDGTVLVLLTKEGDLAFVKGTKLTKIADEVSDFVISADGTGVAYTVNEDGDTKLYLYNVKTKKANVVTSKMYGSSYCLSPNGDSIAYFEKKEGDEEAKLMLFKGKKSTKITSASVTLLGLSDNGKYIYVIGKNDDNASVLYSYNKKGDRDKLGAISGSRVMFNEDHTQILFYSDGKSYISTKGKEAVKISSSQAQPILPNSCENFSDGITYTVPTDNLFNKVYSCDGNIWYIRKNTDKSVKLANDASSVTLSEDAKYVYYVNKGELKVLKVSHGDNASDKAKVLAEDISNYVVTSDCKKVYYVSDGSLYAVNGKTGKGKKTVANEDVAASLAINAKDVVYYYMDGDVYASKNGSKGKKVVSDAVYFETTANGIVYVSTEDTLFATKGAKKPAKIYTKD